MKIWIKENEVTLASYREDRVGILIMKDIWKRLYDGHWDSLENADYLTVYRRDDLEKLKSLYPEIFTVKMPVIGTAIDYAED